MIKRFLSIIAILTLSACASMTAGQNQSLSVSTTPSAACTLSNDKGTWYVNTPGTVTVNRAYGDMTVLCKSKNLTATNVVKSSVKPILAGNIIWLWGVVIGIPIDMITGAAYDYPNPIIMPLKEVTN